MSANTNTFDKLMGNCSGMRMSDLTPNDVRRQAVYYEAIEDEIGAAILGLAEYQRLERANSRAARTMGSIRTPKKARSSVENGKRGGRPRKLDTEGQPR